MPPKIDSTNQDRQQAYSSASLNTRPISTHNKNKTHNIYKSFSKNVQNMNKNCNIANFCEKLKSIKLNSKASLDIKHNISPTRIHYSSQKINRPSQLNLPESFREKSSEKKKRVHKLYSSRSIDPNTFKNMVVEKNIKLYTSRSSAKCQN